MIGFHEKRKLSHIFFSKGTIFVLFVVMVLMAYAALNAYEQKKEAVARRSVLSDELGRLEARAGSLTEDISRLEDPRGVETELRRRYDVGKEGEEVIVFIEREQETVPQEEQHIQKKTIFERFKSLFIGE